MTTLRFSLIVLTVALLATGCTGSDGDVCFDDGDCSSGLLCCKTSASTSARGRCTPAAERCSMIPVPDAGDSGGDAGDAGDSTTDAPSDAPVDTTPPMDASLPCDPTADECEATAYCRLSACTDLVGQCIERPERCDGVLEPVCGCDDRTFTSGCEAERSGVSVDRAGSCDPRADTGVMDTGPDAADSSVG